MAAAGRRRTVGLAKAAGLTTGRLLGIHKMYIQLRFYKVGGLNGAGVG